MTPMGSAAVPARTCIMRAAALGLLLLALGVGGSSHLKHQEAARPQERRSWKGYLAVYEHGHAGAPPARRYMLHVEDQTLALDIDPTVAAHVGAQLRDLRSGEAVRVEGSMREGGRLAVRALQPLATGARALRPSRQPLRQNQGGRSLQQRAPGGGSGAAEGDSPGAQRNLPFTGEQPHTVRDVSTLVLILDVCGQAGGPAASAAQLEEVLFGNGGPQPSLSAIYGACSHGLARLDASNSRVVGPLRIACEGRTANGLAWDAKSREGNLERWHQAALDKAQMELGVDGDAYRHHVVVLPANASNAFDGSCSPWSGMAVIGSRYPWEPFSLSWVNGNAALDRVVYAHEIAHNLNLGHAYRPLPTGGRGADESCLMSTSYKLTCFNAPHAWQLGWGTPLEVLTPETLQAGTWRMFSIPAQILNVRSMVVLTGLDQGGQQKEEEEQAPPPPSPPPNTPVEIAPAQPPPPPQEGAAGAREEGQVGLSADDAVPLHGAAKADHSIFISYRVRWAPYDMIDELQSGTTAVHGWGGRTQSDSDDTTLLAQLGTGDTWRHPKGFVVRPFDGGSLEAVVGVCKLADPTGNKRETLCSDGLDNDCDGLTDQFDSDCTGQLTKPAGSLNRLVNLAAGAQLPPMPQAPPLAPPPPGREPVSTLFGTMSDAQNTRYAVHMVFYDEFWTMEAGARAVCARKGQVLASFRTWQAQAAADALLRSQPWYWSRYPWTPMLTGLVRSPSGVITFKSTGAVALPYLASAPDAPVLADSRCYVKECCGYVRRANNSSDPLLLHFSSCSVWNNHWLLAMSFMCVPADTQSQGHLDIPEQSPPPLPPSPAPPGPPLPLPPPPTPSPPPAKPQPVVNIVYDFPKPLPPSPAPPPPRLAPPLAAADESNSGDGGGSSPGSNRDALPPPPTPPASPSTAQEPAAPVSPHCSIVTLPGATLLSDAAVEFGTTVEQLWADNPGLEKNQSSLLPRNFMLKVCEVSFADYEGPVSGGGDASIAHEGVSCRTVVTPVAGGRKKVAAALGVRPGQLIKDNPLLRKMSSIPKGIAVKVCSPAGRRRH